MRKLATITAAALIATAVIAAAGTALASPLRSTWITCEDGEASTGLLTVDGADQGGVLHVSGQVNPCGPPARTDVYTVAAYYLDHAAAVSDAYSGGTADWAPAYEDGRPSTFADSIQIDRDVQAICLVTGAQARAHCYEITTTASADGNISTPTVGPAIPTTDPRVQAAVPCPSPPRLSGPPSCGSCW